MSHRRNLLTLPARVAAAAVLVACLTPAGRTSIACADCPESILGCNGVETPTVLPVDGVSCTASTAASFSVPLGRIDVTIPQYEPLFVHQARALVREDFTFYGSTPGVPFTFRLRVHVQGTAYSAGGFGDNAGVILSLQPTQLEAGDPTPTRGWGTAGGFRAFDDSLDLVVTRLGGSPVGLTLDASAGANGYGYATGALSFQFVDLPPGWSVTSCKGYAQDGPVAARGTSWGRVKASYR